MNPNDELEFSDIAARTRATAASIYCLRQMNLGIGGAAGISAFFLFREQFPGAPISILAFVSLHACSLMLAIGFLLHELIPNALGAISRRVSYVASVLAFAAAVSAIYVFKEFGPELVISIALMDSTVGLALLFGKWQKLFGGLLGIILFTLFFGMVNRDIGSNSVSNLIYDVLITVGLLSLFLRYLRRTTRANARERDRVDLKID